MHTASCSINFKDTLEEREREIGITWSSDWHKICILFASSKIRAQLGLKALPVEKSHPNATQDFTQCQS